MSLRSPTVYTHHISAILTDIDFRFESGRTWVGSFINLVWKDERARCTQQERFKSASLIG